MDFIIKKFSELTNYELYEILKQRTDVFVVEQNCPYHECDGKDLPAIHVFSKDNEKITSYLRILPKGISFDEVGIGRVLVNMNYRNKGIARELMWTAMKYISENMNENKIKLSAQQYLVSFYKSLGFEEISDVYLDDGIPHIDMIYGKNS